MSQGAVDFSEPINVEKQDNERAPNFVEVLDRSVVYDDFVALESVTGDTVAYVSRLPSAPGAQILREVPFAILSVLGCIILTLRVGAVHLHRNAKFLEDALRGAREANRLKDDFIATIGHGLRTPLTMVAASISVLTQGMLGKLPDRVLEVLKVCERNNSILGSLIEDLLLMGAIDSGNFRLDRRQSNAQELLSTSVEDFQGVDHSAFASKWDKTAPAATAHTRFCNLLDPSLDGSPVPSRDIASRRPAGQRSAETCSGRWTCRNRWPHKPSGSTRPNRRTSR